MTESYSSTYPAPIYDPVPVPSTAGDLTPPPAEEPKGTADIAKDQAASVSAGASEAGQHVAGVAKEQVGQVAAEAGRQAKDLMDQARTELSSQGGAQQKRLASSLHSLGDELHSMADNNGEKAGVATDLAKQAAGKTKDVASWLESREPGDVLEEVKSFARQRPVAFLALAAGAGLLAGRLTRGVKDATSDSDSADTGTHLTNTPTTTPTAPNTATPALLADPVPFASSQDGLAADAPYAVNTTPHPTSESL